MTDDLIADLWEDWRQYAAKYPDYPNTQYLWQRWNNS